ncbi:MAG: hypothetical protein Q9181_005759 [Wetmoreana brouardii]
MEALRINVRSGPHTPGSRVSGTVSLHGDGTHNVQTIKIIFAGRCKTKVTENGYNNTRIHHRGRVPLFHYEQTLFKGPYTLRAPHQWQFNFTFPQQCNTCGGRFFKSSSSVFDDDMHQPLPPSFSHGSSSLMGSDVETFICYELEAALVTPPNTRGNLQVTKTLTLKVQRGNQNPEPRLSYACSPQYVQSLYLLPGYQHRAPTLGEKLKAKVKSGKLPKAQYLLKALLPTVGVLGQPLPLALGVSHDEHHSTTTDAPTVFLRKVNVKLVSTTWVRCASGSMWSSNDVIEQVTSDHRIGEQDFSHEHLQMADRMDISSMMGLALSTGRSFFSESLAPTFKTFNITRSYILKVHVTTECGKQKRFKDFNSSQFLLLAEDCLPSAFFPPTAVVQAVQEDTAGLTSYDTEIKSERPDDV